MKLLRLLISIPVLGFGLLIGLYGVFALTFNDTGGSTEVTLEGHRLDAHLIGGVSLVIGLGAMAAAVVVMRRGRSSV